MNQHQRKFLLEEIEKQYKHARCIYCNSVFMLGTEELHNALADHITSCEKSPLVQAMEEGQAIVEETLNALQDPAEVWAMMLRGEIARPQALDHYEQCKTELEQVQNALDNYWREHPTTLAAVEAVMKDVNERRIRCFQLECFLLQLRAEVDCRIEHGAESGGHLEYVLEQLKQKSNSLTPSNPLDKKEGQ